MNAARGWLRHARIVVCMIAVLVLGAVTVSASGASSGPDPQGTAGGRADHFGGPGRFPDDQPPASLVRDAAADPAGTEVPSKRTATSRTWKTDDGRFHTRVYSTPVNYRDGNGDWRQIDDSLVADQSPGFALENNSDRYRAQFPDDLGAKPIQVSEGGDSVGFRLLGANGHATASGATARFADALPGVAAVYTAQPSGVKEDLKLASADAPASYDYAVNLSDGLSLRENAAGGVDVVDAAGGIQFSFEAPYASDQAGARIDNGSQLSLKVVRDGDSPQLRLAVDPAWLKDADREFPVVIDPGLNVSDNRDCYMLGGAWTNVNGCGNPDLLVGYNGATPYRTMVRFDVASAVPANAAISGANMAVYLKTKDNSTALSVGAHQINHSWTTAATWNKFDGTTAWTNPGGDFNATPEYTCSNAANGAGTWDFFSVSNLVQRWMDGATPNNGVLLKATNETTANVLHFATGTDPNPPYLQVDWEPKFMGSQPWYPMVGQTQIDDSEGLAVNAAGGNLVVQSTDLGVAGVGLPFTVSRTYNNLSPDMDSWGYGWQINGGFDMWLDQYNDSQTFFDATGTPFHFTKNSDGSYTSPPGIDATLKRNADATNTITYNQSRVQLNFDDDGDRLTSVKDRNGNALTYTYGTNGHPSAVTDTQGRTTTFGYDTGSWSPRINLITDSTGRSVSYTYYPSGGPLKTFTDGAGKTTTYSYDGDGDLTKVVDGNGNITQIGYDTSYRVTSIKRITDNTTLVGNTTTFTYNTGNTVVTDPLGHTQTVFFDSAARTTKATDANGQSALTQYNADNQPTVSTTPLNQSYTAAYDGTFRGMSSQQPDVVNGGTNGLKSQRGYDSTITSQSDPRFWLPKTATDTEGNAATYTYDSLGNVKTSTDSLGTTSYTYNADGTVATSTDGNGQTTTYTYTGGNLTKVTPPSPLAPQTATYDTLGRPQTTTDGNGVTGTFTYDGDDRVTSVAYTNGPTITGTYDADGNVLTTTDPTGTTTNTYDRLSRLTYEAMPNGKSNSYGYDAANHLKTLQDAGGTTSYNYDAADQLTSAQAPGEAQLTTFTYYADGAAKDTTYPNGVVTHNDYDNPSRLTLRAATRAGTTLASYAYTYKNGTLDTNLLRSVTDKNGAQTSYGYDTRDQLTSATNAAAHNYTYRYDPAGNLTQSSKDTAYTSFGYSAANTLCWKATGQQVSSACSSTPVGATTFNSDGAGNMTGSTAGFSAHYNKLQQTTDMTAIGGGSSLAFSYRGSGQGLRSTAGPSSYTDNSLGLGMQQDASGATCFSYTPGGELLSERLPTGGGTCNGPRYYYITDGQGSVTALTDSSGTVQDTYAYDPYGVTTVAGSVPNPWRYTGGYQDTTGMYKLGARYYSPDLMHWTQQDPVGSGCTYAGDDPVNNTDLSGMDPTANHRSCDNAFTSKYANANISIRRTGRSLAWGFQLTPTARKFFSRGLQLNLSVTVNGHPYAQGTYHKLWAPSDYHWHSYIKGVTAGSVVRFYFRGHMSEGKAYRYVYLIFSCRA
jgi:RHS repeat-associated protein